MKGLRDGDDDDNDMKNDDNYDDNYDYDNHDVVMIWWWCGDITSNPIDDQHFDIWVYMGYILPNLPTTNMTTLPWLGVFRFFMVFSFSANRQAS